MKKTIFIAAFMMAANGLFAQCSELFFSEYLEGSGNNKGMEIYNPTDQVINLNAYYLARYSNGSNTFTNGGITQLEGFLQPYETHLIVNGQTVDSDISPASDPELRAMAQQLDGAYPAPTYMNGNDAMALFKDNGGSGDIADFELVDLFGIIGGGMPADGAGWAAFTDEWVYKNIYEGGEIVGRDSVYIENYIVPDGYWWIPWSRDHALVRKPNIMKGVTAATMPTEEFNVTLEWDTVPGGADVWDSLNAHYCYCEFGTDIGTDEIIESFSMFPNPSVSTVRISYDEGIDRITVFDLSGKLIYRSNHLKGIRQEELNIDHLNKGIYMVRIESGSRILTRKLVKK